MSSQGSFEEHRQEAVRIISSMAIDGPVRESVVNASDARELSRALKRIISDNRFLPSRHLNDLKALRDLLSVF